MGGDDVAAPLSASEVEALMAPFQPFEPEPRLAVAVSGGADSLCLALCLDVWARARGGGIRALTVDHGLRPESAREAEWVGGVLRARGIPHAIATWRGAPPERGIQAAARRARYRLLAECCEAEGLLHLAVGHHRDDQGETVLIRLRDGSGVSGLAGMPAQRELAHARLIRPFLPVPKARLEATLREMGVAWVEDPSNRDPAFARGRVRALSRSMEREGLDNERLATMAGYLGQARRVVEDAVDTLLARAAWIHPAAGFAWLASDDLCAARPLVGREAVARLVRTISGATHLPRSERVARLHAEMTSGGQARARTLGGCRVVPRAGGWLVVREWARMPRTPFAALKRELYDDRFALAVSRSRVDEDLAVGPLGREGWAALTAIAPQLRAHAVPPQARPALPALFDAEGVREVPALRWSRQRGVPREAESVPGEGPIVRVCELRPRRGMSEAGFTVARGKRHIIL